MNGKPCPLKGNMRAQVFQLPMSEAKHFADLLDDLAAEGDNLGILHYGICMPTLVRASLSVLFHARSLPCFIGPRG